MLVPRHTGVGAENGVVGADGHETVRRAKVGWRRALGHQPQQRGGVAGLQRPCRGEDLALVEERRVGKVVVVQDAEQGVLVDEERMRVAVGVVADPAHWLPLQPVHQGIEDGVRVVVDA